MKGLFLVILLVSFFSVAGQPASPFTGKTAQCDSEAYSFIVTGHFYGSSNSLSKFPASTIQAATDTLNNLDASFLVSLGDLFPSLDPAVIENYKRSIFRRLQIPLYNVPGNHDLMSGDYNELFGETWFSFRCEKSVFLFLDTETNNGSISGDQLKMLKETLVNAVAGTNFFIFSHRTLWTDGVPELGHLFPDNTRSITGNNFRKDILPLLEKASGSAGVYWFSGSMGSAPASFFYHKKDNMHFITSAIRDLPRDAVLKVMVKGERVSFETISITSEQVKPLESYNLDFYKTAVPEEKKFNYRLLPLMIYQTVTSPAFWWGSGSTLFLIFIYRLIRRRRSRNDH